MKNLKIFIRKSGLVFLSLITYIITGENLGLANSHAEGAESRTSMVDKMYNALKGKPALRSSEGTFPGNDYPSFQEFAQRLEYFVEGKIFDLYDGIAQIGNVDSYVGVTAISVTSYRTVIPKMWLLQYLIDFREYTRISQQPSNFTFDQNGEITIGPDTFDNVTFSIEANPYDKGILGYYIRMKADDTLVGNSSMTLLQPDSAWSQTYQLDDQGGQGGVFLFNHTIQDTLTVSPNVDGAAPPDLAVTIDGVVTGMASEFMLCPDELMNLNITGSNINIFVYPVVMTTAMKHLFWTHFVANQLDTLGDTLLESIRKQVG